MAMRRAVTRTLPRAAAARSFSSMAPAQQPTLVSTLPNQLRIASESTGGETATVGMWIDTGSRYETDANNGVAHFLEHLAFKGTSKRSQLQLETEIENMGGHLNAYTSREQTVYYAKVLKKDVPQATELLSDILTNSTFSQAAVERERDVILREMEEVESITEEVIFDMLHECAYVGTPLARTILGPVANIKSISAEDIKSYIGTHYTAPRMVFAASGAVEHDQLVDLAAEHFGGVQSEPPPGAVWEDAPSLFTGADVRDFNDDMETAHFALAFEGLKWTDPDIFSLMLCQSLLGTYDAKKSGGELTSAKLASDLAKLDAGVKLMQPFCTCYTDTGLFGVYFEMAMAKKEHVDDTIGTIQEELVALTTGTTDDDLATAKANLKYNLMMQMDGTSPNAEEIGRQMLVYGRRMSLAETFARVDAIESADVTRVAEKIIWDQEVSFAAIGPNLKYAYDINGLRRGTFWHRM
jgi:processing peptidase subunit beta